MAVVASRWPWMALLLLVARAAAAASAASPPGRVGGFRRRTTSTAPRHQLHRFRGGGGADSDSEYDSEYDDSECDDEGVDAPIATDARKLAASTRATAQKRKAAAVKSKVKVALAASSASSAASAARKPSGPGLYQRRVPYIVRACLNPFTLFAMTKAYFASLCDINYFKEDQSQTLRSALEEKARRQQPAAGPPKRKMKPGQAKTISDLPQLSA